MKRIPEAFLHYLWKYKLFYTNDLSTCNEEPVEILIHGDHNQDAGPDFLNAKIKIGDTLWAGNVEIHINSSDWYKHGHHKDKAYDNVILQVVLNHDKEIFRTNGTQIATMELKFSKKLYENYETLLLNESWIPCEDKIKETEEFIINFWLSKLTIERLEDKANQIEQQLTKNKNDWENTFYQMLAKNFGFKTNGQPFEMLAKTLPLTLLAKHKNNLLQVEALLFGQAGFLEQDQSDSNTFSLNKEYKHLKNKFRLKPIDKHMWKFSRLRPANFPTIRIAQFAQLIHKSQSLFSKIMETSEIKSLQEYFEVTPSEYWHKHYRPGKLSAGKKKTLGVNAFHNIVINTIVPFLFVYGTYKENEIYRERALSYLQKIPPEKNKIIKQWKKIGITAENAYYSQALLQLKNNYCRHKKCLSCEIGNKIIKQTNHA